MLVQISEIKINISEIGLLNPITVDDGYTLIAGLHRLEAAKLLGWTQIECTVSDLEGLQTISRGPTVHCSLLVQWQTLRLF